MVLIKSEKEKRKRDTPEKPKKLPRRLLENSMLVDRRYKWIRKNKLVLIEGDTEEHEDSVGESSPDLVDSKSSTLPMAE